MEIKFIITLEDGSTIYSHDDAGNSIHDHVHALAPHNTKKWLHYTIISPNGVAVNVNFKTGIFNVGGVDISPTDEKEILLTNDTTPQEFPVTKEWEILNGLPYFPVVGRRMVKGDWGEMTFGFCGWKRKVGDKTIQKLMYLSSDGKIIMT